MAFTDTNLARLTEPLDPARVKSREAGRGQSLSYIEAHDAIRTANEVFGIGGWGYTVEELEPLGEPEAVKRDDRTGYRVGYRAVVRVTVRGAAGDNLPPLPVVFSDVGYGDGMDYSGSRITVHELAMKEAVSDAVKRALKNLGSQFGLDLYDKEARKDIERRSALAKATPAKLKQEVWKIAKAALGKDKPTAKEVAAHFGVKAGDLPDEETLRGILRKEGLL